MVKKALALALALASTVATICAEAAPAGRFIEGSIAKENIDRVNSNIRWNSSLAGALETARRENKMVLWIQMIGHMSGST